MTRGPWSFTLAYPRPPRGLHANDRASRHVKARSTKDVREEVFWRVRAAKVPALERCRVDVVWYVPDNRKRDTDNLAPLLKAIYDGVGSDRGVSARIVDDDDPAHMEKPSATIARVLGLTGFMVTITELPLEAQ